MDPIDYKPTLRFSKKANVYKYRPDYPDNIIDIIRKEIKTLNDLIIADIGAGTGKLTRFFLENNNLVYAVEPNNEMYNVLCSNLKKFNNFNPINSTAENTSLKDNKIDIITVGQALHWFNLDEAKKEFYRILKTPGYMIIARKDNKLVNTKLSNLIKKTVNKYCLKNKKTNLITEKQIKSFYSPYKCSRKKIKHKIIQNYENLIGGLLSNSSAPDENDDNYNDFINEVKNSCERCIKDDSIETVVNTTIYYGRFK